MGRPASPNFALGIRNISGVNSPEPSLFPFGPEMENTLPDRVRLGVFEVDLRVGELREGERSLILPEQALLILRMLVEGDGELVEREEIQKRLWPNDTVVEFDHSINTAMRKLRRALGDSPDEPKYIETIPRRGYRLLAPVERVSTPGDDASSNGDGGTVVLPLGSRVPRPSADAASLIGKKVSHYRVLSVIGGGGMGLVYEAEDLKLGRRVALKFLPEELAGDPVALQRFEREAQTASSLNHPNICTIYEIEEHEEQPFIVMELLKGETLRDRLAAVTSSQKTLPLNELLDIAIEICEGLQAAHDKGVIHRDIKPANIFLTTAGQVKILDFGLAKLVLTEEHLQLSSRAEVAAAATGVEGPAVVPGLESADPSTSCRPDPQKKRVGEEGRHSAQDDSIRDATISRTGIAMGTAGYMSPEQVRGEVVDARTDIFSFGLVLYEMATGQRAFSGETAVVVHEAILNETPVPVRERNSTLPPSLEKIIDRAIEKDRERRYQSAAEMRTDLESQAGQSTQTESGEMHSRSRWKWLAGVAAVVCVGIVAGVLYWRAHRAPKLTDQDTIVIADFVNQTGDPVFDDTLKQGLAIQLSQSPYINVLSDRKVRDTLKLMKRPASEPLTESVGREVCLRTNSKAMLVGAIENSGSRYVIGVRALDCNVGRSLVEIQETAANKEEVLRALDRVTLALRTRLGESLSSVEKYSTALEQATTPSLEALRAYSIAQKTRSTVGSRAAIPIYERAVELDPSFAMAFRSLAALYGNTRQNDRAKECSRKAYELRDKVSQREKLAIEGAYYEKVTGELHKAAQAYEVWQQNYPGDYTAIANLGAIYSELGQLEKYLEQARAAMRRDPNHPLSYESLEQAYINLNRLDEAEEVYKQAEQRFANPFLYVNWYDLAFLKGNAEQMAHLAALATGEAAVDTPRLNSLAGTEAWHGKIRHARMLVDQAIESARRDGSAADYLAMEALSKAPTVTPHRTRADATDALKLSKDPEIRGKAALAMAMAGDAAFARNIEAELEQDYPLSTQVQEYWLPTIRAALALQAKDPDRAIELLKKTSDIELAQPCLCSAYIRGKAYLMLGDGKAAAAEFQKYIDHYGLVGDFTWGALARLQLARSYELEAANDPAARERARTAYQNFLTLWKDADPDIPIYKQAKAEYAKLQ